MTKKFRLEGLDCANCAAKVERAVAKVEGIESAVVNFMTTKLILETKEEGIEERMQEVERVIKKADSGIRMRKA